MRICANVFFLLLTALAATLAFEVELNQNLENQQRCEGMYGPKSWAGSDTPHILVKFMDTVGRQNSLPVGLLIFEWTDKYLIGNNSPGDVNKIHYMCDDAAIESNMCTRENLGKFILDEHAQDKSNNEILTKAVDAGKNMVMKYEVKNTGFYCVITGHFDKDQEYSAIVEFRNSYGELEASQIAKLPFYGGLAVMYAIILIIWAILYVKNRSDILPVQNYITAILIFLVVEMLMTWGFYQYQNINGNDFGALAMMIIVSILNAARNSFSFFLLLIVCMGYGVVKPTLGSTMVIVRWLAVAHFVFAMIYVISSLTMPLDDIGPIVLLVVLPLSATLTAFYIWTLGSLNRTIKDLIKRKQSVKTMMYKKLWWCILISVLVIFGFFFITSFSFAGSRDPNFAPEHWQTRWFILDGWLNLVYLADVAFVTYIWRPTRHNRRFAMSDEIAQDDEGFEINDMRDSLDDLELAADSHAGDTSRYDAVPGERDISPLPAPKPQKPVVPPRDSIGGDTIFAIGEDGSKWSDDELEIEDNGTERLIKENAEGKV